MSEKDNELEFTLEDILKEFGSNPPEPAVESPESPEDIPAELSPEEEPTVRQAPADAPAPEESPEEILIFQPKTESVPEEDHTQRFTAVPEDQTLRMDAGEIRARAAQLPLSGDTVVFTPLTEADTAEPEPQAVPEVSTVPIPEGAEPFSAGWEPEYEQPIGEYVPPEPLVFRPRSRLSELKQKLVAGPERRYYALAEKGTVRLQICIFLSLLVVILSVVSILLYRMNLVQPDRMRLLVFGELFAMVFSALLGSHQLLEGFASMFKGKFNLDSLLAVTFLVCFADGFFCLQEVRVPFCAAFCLQVTMSLWAELERRNTEMGQMDTLRKATRLHRVAKAPDCYEGRAGYCVHDGQVEDFMDTYSQPSRPEKVASVYAILAVLVSGAIALYAGLKGGVSTGLQTWSAAILAAAPVTIFVCQTRPMAVLERRLHRLGSVICGWQGVKAMSGAAVIPLSDSDLFPAGSVKINGMKFYSQRDPDQIIAYAASLIGVDTSCLAPLFIQLLESRNGIHFDPDTFRRYEKGGIGGEVCGESVLIGTLSFLQDMGVDLPENTRVNQAVYVAIDGELCGVFAMAFGRLKGVSAGLGTLCSNRGLTPVLTSDNFLLDEGLIRSKFGVNTRRFAFPGMEERHQVAAWNPDPETVTPCALTTHEGLASAAFAITGARALRSATNLGTFIHIFGGVIGLLIVLALTIVEGGALLTPANLLLFELIWAVPGLLITEWTRHL